MTDLSFARWPNLSEAQAHHQRRIDDKAGAVRQRFAPDWLIDEEYWLTAQQAQAYADGGYSGDVPEAVQSWADAANMTAKEAADDILATRQDYEQALMQIRRIRLVAKQQAAKASAVRDVYAAAEQGIANLDSVTPP